MNDKPTILAVDDRSESLSLLNSLLVPAGYKVISADSGELALAAVAAAPPDLILLDVRMQGIDGLEVCQRLKADSKTQSIPVILISAFSDVDYWDEGFKLGASDYITKPFQAAELLARIKTHLNLSQAKTILEDQAAVLDQKDEQLKLEIANRQEVEDKLRQNLAQIERSRLALLSTLEDQQRVEQQSQRLLKQQIAANQLALSLGETNELTTIFQIIYSHVKELMDVSVFAISRFDDKSKMIYASYFLSGGSEINTQKLPPIPLEESGKGTQSQVIRTGNVLYISDYYRTMNPPQTIYTVDDSNGDVKEGPPPQEEESTQSAIYVPMKDMGAVVGVMQVQSYRLDAYNQEDIDLLSALASVASLAIQNARLFEEARQRLDRLQALRRIDLAISGKVNLLNALGIVLEQVTNQLKVDAATVLLCQKELNTLEFAVSRGFRTTALQHSNLKLGEGLAGESALRRQMIVISDLSQVQTELSRSEHIMDENFVSYIGVPLITQAKVIGVLEIFNRSKLDPEPEWLEFLNVLATQAAIAIDNATLFIDLEQANIEITRSYDSTLEGWAKALELKDTEIEGHSQRVVDLTIKIAHKLKIRDDELDNIRRGALLHDIGKMGIPDSILLKPGPLTPAEWEIMRKHPVYAFEWLSPIPYLQKALEIPYCHHERWDGTGYPQGLKEEKIPISARIFAIVDVWDALTSDRPYRKAWSKQKTISHIQEQSGLHFDPRVVDTFLKLVAKGL